MNLAEYADGYSLFSFVMCIDHVTLSIKLQASELIKSANHISIPIECVESIMAPSRPRYDHLSNRFFTFHIRIHSDENAFFVLR